VLATVRRLKALGVQLAIDDFDTGYSSFSCLKRFAVNRLKIDQSFVRDLAIDPDNAAIVKAVVQMALSLGLQTVAEGVEDQRVLAHLQEPRCDQVQGYYFAKPMPAAAFAAYFAGAQERAGADWFLSSSARRCRRRCSALLPAAAPQRRRRSTSPAVRWRRRHARSCERSRPGAPGIPPPPY
jgi:predicted signal transduction protein with EAL and GGDEF domain